jgi:hypothetical protein
MERRKFKLEAVKLVTERGGARQRGPDWVCQNEGPGRSSAPITR